MKILLWGSVSLISLIVLLVQVENWRGRRVWNEVRQKLEDAGEPVAAQDLVARVPHVPDAENFGAIEALKGIAMVVEDDPDKGEPGRIRERLQAVNVHAHFGEPRSGYQTPKAGNYRVGRKWNFEAWAAYLLDEAAFKEAEVQRDAKAIVGKFLESHEDLFAELDSANGRAKAVFVPTILEATPKDRMLISMIFPHGSPVIALIRALGLRAALAAETVDGEVCQESLMNMVRLSEAMANERTLISVLISVSSLLMADDGLHRFLEDQLYQNDAELVELFDAIGNLDYAVALDEAARTEWVYLVDSMNWFVKMRKQKGGLPKEWSNEMGFFRWMPTGWIDQNKALSCRILSSVVNRDESLYPGLLGMRTLFESEMDELQRRKARFDPTAIIASVQLPYMEKVIGNVAYGEAVRAQMETAVALERYHLANDEYPETLDVLEPRFIREIPLDPVDAQPMRYQKTEGGYLLYSIGMDRVDDSGAVTLDDKKSEKSAFYFSKDDYKGDWVWEISRSQQDR